MKLVNKNLLSIGIVIVVLSIGGFINDYFIKGESGYSKLVFQIFTLLTLVLGFVTYPWKKSPWRSFAGSHTIFYLIVWLGGIDLIRWHASPIKNLFFFLKGLILINFGVYLVVQNYKGKYIKDFEFKNSKDI
jgi:hypothetical protein